MAMEVKIHKKLGEYELECTLEIHEEKKSESSVLPEAERV